MPAGEKVETEMARETQRRKTAARTATASHPRAGSPITPRSGKTRAMCSSIRPRPVPSAARAHARLSMTPCSAPPCPAMCSTRSRPTWLSSNPPPSCASSTATCGPGRAASATSGCCHGSCTHVWNYAQAIPHLFPALERTFREQELQRSMDERGHVNFRSALPDGPTAAHLPPRLGRAAGRDHEGLPRMADLRRPGLAGGDVPAGANTAWISASPTGTPTTRAC